MTSITPMSLRMIKRHKSTTSTPIGRLGFSSLLFFLGTVAPSWIESVFNPLNKTQGFAQSVIKEKERKVKIEK
jgi:hypothetical protein